MGWVITGVMVGAGVVLIMVGAGAVLIMVGAAVIIRPPMVILRPSLPHPPYMSNARI